jgi:hypothetical protein
MMYCKRFAFKAPAMSRFPLRSVPCLWLLLLGFLVTGFQKKSALKTRLIVMTDITSLVSGYKEPDDGQSLVRLMLYSNNFEIEGLLATSNLEHAQTTRPDLIQQVVEAYRKDRNNLLKHDPAYPPADYLLSVIKTGNPVAGKAIPLLPNIGEGKDTEASEWIIKVVDEPDRRPVWITIWGGATDLAQALWKVKQKRTASALKKFISKIRVRSISDQDGAGPWIRSTFPDLYFVLQKVNMRGIYRGGDTSLSSADWVRTHIKGQGALGELYPEYKGGDIWTRQLGSVRGIKEGDTPSFLALLNNGLNEELNPEWISWGGRSRRDSTGTYFVDAIDSIENYQADPHPALASVYRWRPAFQADFAARLAWCTKSFEEANHPPQPDLRVSKTKDGWILDASGSADPDSDGLSFLWFQDKPASTYKEDLTGKNNTGKALAVPAIRSKSKQTVHIILAVTDSGRPALTRYKRVVLSLTP